MITFAVETLDVVKAAQPLVEAHWQEVVRDERQLNVDWAAFERVERAGALRVFTARQEGELKGYAVFILAPHLHSKDKLTAQNDAVFMAKEMRRGRNALRFLSSCMKQLEDVDLVDITIWHVKTWLNFGPLLELLGCRPAEVIYAKFRS